MADYWQRTYSRRRAIVGATGFGLGGAALALLGCSSGASTTKKPANNLTPAQDTSSKATRGGLFQTHTLIEPTTFDAIGGNSTSISAASWVYNRMVSFDVGRLKRPAPTIVGDFAESFEISPDALQVTFKVRQNEKFDARPPTNSRAADADDALWSWNRYASLSPSRANLAYTKDAPNAPVESMRSVDSKTVVAKLAFPSAEVLDLFGAVGPFIMPKEFDDKTKADSRNTMLGTGAWTLSKYEASVGIHYKRNPNWWLQDRPFLDGFDVAFITDRSQEIAQFRAGNTWWSGIPAEQQLQTKADLPELLMMQGTDLDVSSPHVKFGWRPDSPFKDERVRRAVSMAIDRDLFGNTLSNRPQFEAAGYPQDLRWASHLGAGLDGYWLDPRTDSGKALGEGGKYYQHDVTEAKKLLAAAGHTDTIATESHFNAGTNYGQDYHNIIEIVTGMIEEIGFKIARKPHEYQTDWLPNYFYGKGDFNGISWVPGSARSAVGQFLQTFYHSSGQANIPPGVDPKLDKMIEDQARELDKMKRTDLIHDIQRYLALGMEVVPYNYAVPGFTLAWPWVQNFGVFVNWPGIPVEQSVYIQTWMDKTKAPDRFKS